MRCAELLPKMLRGSIRFGDREMSAFTKFIFECDEDNLILAARAAKSILHDQSTNECLLAFGDGKETLVEMYGRRLKRSISVKQVKP